MNSVHASPFYYFRRLMRGFMVRENIFQAKFKIELTKEFPDSIILKNDARYIQGIPDLIILNGPNWAALECKRSADAKHRPNQDYYVDKMNEMSYAAFVYPENEKEILHDLQRALQLDRQTRFSQS